MTFATGDEAGFRARNVNQERERRQAVFSGTVRSLAPAPGGSCHFPTEDMLSVEC